jgi:hypothetical protein
MPHLLKLYDLITQPQLHDGLCRTMAQWLNGLIPSISYHNLTGTCLAVFSSVTSSTFTCVIIHTIHTVTTIQTWWGIAFVDICLTILSSKSWRTDTFIIMLAMFDISKIYTFSTVKTWHLVTFVDSWNETIKYKKQKICTPQSELTRTYILGKTSLLYKIISTYLFHNSFQCNFLYICMCKN